MVCKSDWIALKEEKNINGLSILLDNVSKEYVKIFLKDTGFSYNIDFQKTINFNIDKIDYHIHYSFYNEANDKAYIQVCYELLPTDTYPLYTPARKATIPIVVTPTISKPTTPLPEIRLPHDVFLPTNPIPAEDTITKDNTQTKVWGLGNIIKDGVADLFWDILALVIQKEKKL